MHQRALAPTLDDLDELVELAHDPERLDRFFAEHRDFFLARVRAFYGEGVIDAERIAWELMRLELQSIVG